MKKLQNLKKSAFTLAEVLITLGIIGVVAAIVMPSVMTSYQYKTVGVKLSKFASQLEGATRPFVIMNDNIKDDASIALFASESFITKSINRGTDQEKMSVYCAANAANCNSEGTGENITYSIKTGSPEGSDDSYQDLYDAWEESYVTGPSTTAGAALATALSLSATGEGYGSIPSETVGLGMLKDGTQLIAYKDNASIDESTIDKTKVGKPIMAVAFMPNVQGLSDAVQKTYVFGVTELGYVYPHKHDRCLQGIFNANFQTNASMFTSNHCMSDDRS